ncbi:P-loop containing nucleoside triphosphate hydrolase protein [Dipodascopsis uninucleata]
MANNTDIHKSHKSTEEKPVLNGSPSSLSDVDEGDIRSPTSSVRSLLFAKFTRNKSSYAAVETIDDEFASLPKEEAQLLRAQVQVPESRSNYFTLYRYATSYDRFILMIGVLAAILEGCMRPIMAIVVGSATDTLTAYIPPNVRMGYNSTLTKEINGTYVAGTLFYSNNTEYYRKPDYFMSEDEYYSRVSRLSLFLTLIGIADIIFSNIKTFIFIDRGDILSSRIRRHYLAATLKQNIGYFDRLGSGEITSRITSDTILIQEAMSEKIAFIIANSSSFVISIIIPFTYSAELTGIMLSVLVAIVISTGTSSSFMVKYLKKAQDGYSIGGTLAEEIIASIRNVQAFGIQNRMAQAYDTYLIISEYWSIWAGIAVGMMAGTMYWCSFSTDALAYWQGVRLYYEGQITVGTIIVVIFTIFQGAYSFALVSPYISAVTSGIAAASKIFATIDRQSAIDSSDNSGLKPNSVTGHIELKNIKFVYPSRPNVTILRDFNLSIPAGRTIALVGASGSGKSTIVSLIERFYNPVQGDVFLDGHNIKDINIRWLRQNIALVQQEPTLFSCSIFQNIAYGLIGTSYEHASEIEKRALVIEACKQANAMTFIETLPEGLDTNVGERGFLMSGGQKQRIAIARAIVSNPKILLLDEATSALDTKSEGIVQEALDRASKNRTTIVIAHRLSTIKDADSIVVMRRGVILEMGTHNDLLEKNGEYTELVKAQQIETVKEKQKEEIENELQNMEKLDEKEILQYKEFDNSVRETLSVSPIKTAKSVSSAILASQSEIEDPRPTTREAISFIVKLSMPEFWYNIVGFIASACNGSGYVLLGIVYGFNLQAFQDITNLDYLRQIISRNAGLLFLLSSGLGISNFFSGASFGYSSSRLVRRIRYVTLRQIMRQDISFFDKDENAVGSLTGTLSRDAQSVEGLGGVTLGKMLDAMVTVFGACVASIIVAYKFGLVVTATVPVVLGCGFYRFYLLTQFEENVKKDNASTSAFACEATSSIRTIAALTREKDIYETYSSALDTLIKGNRKTSFNSAFFYGICQGQLYLTMALSFWFGGRLLGTGEYSVFQFYFVFMSIVFGADSAGYVFSFAPDIGKAIEAAKNIKILFERVPEIDAWSEEGDTPMNVRGEIEFRNVHFRYPTRPEVPVLRGLNLKIKPGQYIALVGASGCGKSTTIGLIEEFYRPLSGNVLLDGKDIKEFNINKYRQNIALVSQEPTLYAGSIKYNICLGSERNVTEEEIVSSCKQANIHDFIMSLPDGYETLCGNKGGLLSGGQKQRIAIARALVRQPKVLLLDEATSALDSESEKIVQAALDAAAKGRTTIAIAHRLSTIQNADVIFVLDAGRVCEAGTHKELLEKKGRYYELVKLQALEESS